MTDLSSDRLEPASGTRSVQGQLNPQGHPCPPKRRPAPARKNDSEDNSPETGNPSADAPSHELDRLA
jgi:hypothetical protein